MSPAGQLSTAQDGIPSWAVVSPARRAHILRVADLIGSWAEARGLSDPERARWKEAALLHDALRDAPAEVLDRWVPELTSGVELRHGPAAAAAALALGSCDDPEILAAVRWHTVGWVGWKLLGKALYTADFLDPHRSFLTEQRANLARRFPLEPDPVFRQVVQLRFAHAEREGWTIPAETLQLMASLR